MTESAFPLNGPLPLPATRKELAADRRYLWNVMQHFYQLHMPEFSLNALMLSAVSRTDFRSEHRLTEIVPRYNCTGRLCAVAANEEVGGSSVHSLHPVGLGGPRTLKRVSSGGEET